MARCEALLGDLVVPILVVCKEQGIASAPNGLRDGTSQHDKRPSSGEKAWVTTSRSALRSMDA